MKTPDFSDFALFILSHKRPENPTYKTLMKCNYSGPLYFVVDDLDPTIPEYQKLYGKDKVLIFNKEKVAKRIDFMDNWVITAIDTYARNSCFDFAKKLGVKYFLILDDDYDSFRYRFPGESSVQVKHMNEVIYTYVDYVRKHPKITILAWAQGADLSVVQKGETKRKVMNAMFCATDRFVTWNGHMNDDVNAYTRYNQLGYIFITFPFIQLNQEPTQTTGGSAGMYKEIGTYQKSWYSILQCPSFIKISTFSKGFRMSKYRIHHKISFNNGCAKIISSKYKK